MGTRSKITSSNFNTVLKRLTRPIKIEDLTYYKGSISYKNNSTSGDVEVARRDLNALLEVPEYKLLSNEVKKWSLKDPKAHESWCQAYYALIENSPNLRRFESLYRELYFHISPFVCATQGVNDADRELLTPEARARSLIEKRRRKVTNSLSGKILWAPGTLLYLKDFISYMNWNINWATFALNRQHVEYYFKNWVIPISDDTRWDWLLNKSSSGHMVNAHHNVPKALLDNIEISKTRSGGKKSSTSSKAHGVVLDDILVCGKNSSYEYTWVRIVKMLVGTMKLALVLHPTLPKEELTSVVGSAYKNPAPVGSKGNANKVKTRLPGKRNRFSTVIYNT